jgi:hypothetical protein
MVEIAADPHPPTARYRSSCPGEDRRRPTRHARHHVALHPRHDNAPASTTEINRPRIGTTGRPGAGEVVAVCDARSAAQISAPAVLCEVRKPPGPLSPSRAVTECACRASGGSGPRTGCCASRAVRRPCGGSGGRSGHVPLARAGHGLRVPPPIWIGSGRTGCRLLLQGGYPDVPPCPRAPDCRNTSTVTARFRFRPRLWPEKSQFEYSSAEVGDGPVGMSGELVRNLLNRFRTTFGGGICAVIQTAVPGVASPCHSVALGRQQMRMSLGRHAASPNKSAARSMWSASSTC